jgi:hypothetical protein
MCTLQGKIWSTRHVRFPRQFTYTRRTLSTGSPRMWQPFMSHRQSWAGLLLLRKRAPDTIHSTPVDQFMDSYPVSLSSQPWSSGGKVKHLSTTDYYAYWTHIASMWSVHSILTHEANPSVINRHKWGLQTWRYWLSTHHSPTFPTVSPPLST